MNFHDATCGATPLPAGIARVGRIFCGCCTVENTWGAVFAELERCERAEHKGDDGLAAAICDHCGLTDHGTSIRGAWLTDSGKESLAFLREYGIGFISDGFWLDVENGVCWGEPRRETDNATEGST